MPQPYSTIVVYDSTTEPAKTALEADLQFRFTESDLWVKEANIHVLTNDAKYGKVNNQLATVTAGDILTWSHVFNLSDLWFINATATADTLIYITAIALSKKEVEELELEV